jgi:predicted NodU family carbamoyl transferase
MRESLSWSLLDHEACRVKILSYNPGHDGAIAFLEDGKLRWSVESEKDSNYRYSSVTIAQVLDAVGKLQELPSVLCMSGWWPRDHHEFLHGSANNAGYRGASGDRFILEKGRYFGGRVDYFSSSHERAHILCALGMSNVRPGTPCYALVWEGDIGAFYEIDAKANVTLLSDVLGQPGNRYGILYGLADPSFPKDGPYPRASDAGKLMALASFSKRTVATSAEEKLLHFLLDRPFQKLSVYEDLENAPHLNAGLDNQGFRDFAGIYSDAIFDRFHRFAETRLERGRLLLIAGGCGLNCDWNSKWRETGLFSDVFVPPVANDSGAAIGTAIDAQLYYTGDPKIEWNAYSGLAFRDDRTFQSEDYDIFDADDGRTAEMLANDLILCWVNGRYEIGPRALGNRSILAAPFQDSTRIRLNEIKQREQFRPIAPVCLEDDARKWFGCAHESPYMLFGCGSFATAKS